MGFLSTDVTPTQGPTATTPPGKAHLTKAFSVATTDTVASVKAVLPAQVSVFRVNQPQAAAGSVTTATVTISLLKDGVTISSGTVTVGATIAAGVVNMSALPNIQPVPIGGDIKVQAQFGPSGTGGPWVFTVEYVE